MTQLIVATVANIKTVFALEDNAHPFRELLPGLFGGIYNSPGGRFDHTPVCYDFQTSRCVKIVDGRRACLRE